ncbi:MAG: PhoD-like phosphatase N-terminal domain-containing protein, partial [Solirubrobacteraceae bacterium]|nr:PhoD-like phosphatase N-terminal domain-containing protein [Solirubrobacteraceae bacterium]
MTKPASSPDQLHDRRAFLRATATATATGTALLSASPASATVPGWLRDRPKLPLGVQTGDPGYDGATVWAKADRPSRMVVEVSRSERFRSVRRFRGPVLGPASDGTGKVRVSGLAPGEDAFYRVILEDLRNPAVRSEPVVGTFRTAPIGRRDVSFTWGGDIAGQGGGINPE